jgi:hypothetical protein
MRFFVAFFKRLLIVVLVAFLLLVAFPVYAAPTLAEMDEARAFLKEGREQFSAQHFDRAATLLEKAHRIMRVPPTGFDLMQAYDGLGKFVEALAIGEEMQKQPAKPNEPQPFVDARIKIDAAMDAIASRTPTLGLKISGTSLADALATIDGVPVAPEQLDRPIRVNPGMRKIRVTAPYCDPFETTQEAEAGAERHYDVDIKLVCKPPPPIRPVPPPPVVPDNLVQSKRNGIIAGSVVAGGFALAGVGMAIGSKIANEQAVVVATRAAECIDMDACERVYDVQYGASKGLAISSLFAFGIGVALGTTTLVYGLMGQTSSDAPAPARVSLQVVPIGNGLALRGTW